MIWQVNKHYISRISDILRKLYQYRDKKELQQAIDVTKPVFKSTDISKGVKINIYKAMIHQYKLEMER